MRYVILAGLLAGCATSAPPYTGATYAQARWAPHLSFCRDYAARGGSEKWVVDQCRASEAQAQAEDEAEREQLQAARQQQEDARSDQRLQNFAAAVQTLAQPPAGQVHCTSRTMGSTVYTDCN